MKVSICRLHGAPLFQPQHGCTCDPKNAVMARTLDLGAVEQELARQRLCSRVDLAAREEAEARIRVLEGAIAVVAEYDDPAVALSRLLATVLPTQPTDETRNRAT